MQDVVRKNRMMRGETHIDAKLTDSQVKEIRMSRGVSQYSLARRYGVSQPQISRIIGRKSRR